MSEWNRLQRYLKERAPKINRAEATRYNFEILKKVRYICGSCGEEREEVFKNGIVPRSWRCKEKCFARRKLC